MHTLTSIFQLTAFILQNASGVTKDPTRELHVLPLFKSRQVESRRG